MENVNINLAVDSPLGSSFIHYFQVELEFEMLVSVERGRPEDQEENPRSKDENQQ